MSPSNLCWRRRQYRPPTERAGDLALADIEYMVPSEYMGDAMQNNEAAILNMGHTSECRVGPSCIRIVYKPKESKAGWRLRLAKGNGGKFELG